MRPSRRGRRTAPSERHGSLACAPGRSLLQTWAGCVPAGPWFRATCPLAITARSEAQGALLLCVRCHAEARSARRGAQTPCGACTTWRRPQRATARCARSWTHTCRTSCACLTLRVRPNPAGADVCVCERRAAAYACVVTTLTCPQHGRLCGAAMDAWWPAPRCPGPAHAARRRARRQAAGRGGAGRAARAAGPAGGRARAGAALLGARCGRPAAGALGNPQLSCTRSHDTRHGLRGALRRSTGRRPQRR